MTKKRKKDLVFGETGSFGNTTRVKHYIGGFAVVTQTVGATSPFQTSYLHKDHLGSTDTITDESGQVIQRMSFDTWGKRREINWSPFTEGAITNFNTDITTRGYTGHEQIDEVGLIHMNGRVYDAELGRFLSADPHVQAPDNLQNWNRYSYVLNNPMSYTDPTGYFFSKLFKSIGKAFGKIFSAIGRVFKKVLANPIVRAVIQIVACANPVTCVIASGALTLAAGGSIGDAIKAAAFAFVQIGAWTAVGGVLDTVAVSLKAVGSAATAAGKAAFGVVKSLVHGVVGGALSVAQGGNFLQGFVSNAIGAAAGVVTDGMNNIAGTAIAAAAGCAGAVLSGGKCANGAITAAFADLYNRQRSLAERRARLRAEARSRMCSRQCRHHLGWREVGAAAAVGLGQPLEGTKPFVTDGIKYKGSPGTSHASNIFRGLFSKLGIPETLNHPTTWQPKAIRWWAPTNRFNKFTTSIPRALGRYTPMTGYAILGYDTFNYMHCTLSCIHQPRR